VSYYFRSVHPIGREATCHKIGPSGRHSGELVAVPADSPGQPRWACTRIAVPAGSAHAGIPDSPQDNVHKHPCDHVRLEVHQSQEKNFVGLPDLDEFGNWIAKFESI
jgi:hypothetical protein